MLLCSPLTYGAKITSIEKSKPSSNVHYRSSRGWQHFKGMFCPLKMTSFPWGPFSNQMVAYVHSCMFYQKFEKELKKGVNLSGEGFISYSTPCTYMFDVKKEETGYKLLQNCKNL